MDPVVASLVALLVTNGTSVLDCTCVHLNDMADRESHWLHRVSDGELDIWKHQCQYFGRYLVTGTCGVLKPPSAALSAVARQAASFPTYGPPQPPAGGGQRGGCVGALAGLHSLTFFELLEFRKEYYCRIAADCIDSSSVLRWNNTEWNVTTLQTDALRHRVLSQSLQAVRRITTAITARQTCELNHRPYFKMTYLNKTELQAHAADYLGRLSNFWRDLAQLVSLSATHVSQLLVPLAFEHMGKNTSDQRLHRWIKDVERVKDILHTKLTGWVHDMQYVSKQMLRYEVEEDKDTPGDFKIRGPLLNADLLRYQSWLLSSHDGVLCKERQPEASEMFSLAEALYTFYRTYWYPAATLLTPRYEYLIDIVDEEWQLEDTSNVTLSVDTDCVQLLANALDHPICPLEDLPPETVKQRERCRVQLWDDVVQRSPHIPVTSYLAYTQRVDVNLCLLAWMAVNSYSICQGVPFSMMQSVHDARCYFDSPDDQSCLESKATDAICSVSRALLLLKCRDFSSFETFRTCSIRLHSDGWYNDAVEPWGEFHVEGYPTEKTLNYKNSLNNATLKYKHFKIESLKSLEISFISVNIIFRISTAGIYVYFPHLRNLPGKILLSFQITGIIQILCSEVVYRMAGVPDLSTMVLIDSALTLLSCICLNSFCYQMYACVRHLRLPNQLLPAEVSKLFRREVLYVLIPWSIVCVAAVALEKTSKYYLMHSRIIFLVGISLSVAFNLVCLGLVGYMYLRTRYSMRRLRIVGNNKFASKKQYTFMSVKAIILSGIGIMIRIGFHQAQGIAQFVYYAHIVTMVQGPVLFVCFVCNGTTLPVVKNRLLSLWNPTIIGPGRELCSAAERNLARRNNEHSLAVESPL
ncbi:uncharacterized protein LOC126212729 [Schistocerca nitens]|uniref:uncharacterized protein LOC126212729 n=1 Tax=Schistocerca nitens TaxID=7011 RepID=UPI0021173E05|nr:uncharacterized protein LOC126212729 [Schistocerca nitens]